MKDNRNQNSIADQEPEATEPGKKASPIAGFLQYFYGNFVVLLLGFVSIPLITRVMSSEQYGRTGMFTSAVTVLYIFAILGMDQAYIRFYYVKGINRRSLMANCLIPALVIVGIICALYAIFSAPANEFLFGAQGTDLTLMVICYTVFSVFERFLFLDIRMSQNGKLYSNLNILSKVVYIILIICFARLLGDDFRVVLLAMTLSLGLITLLIGVRYLVINARASKEEASSSRINRREIISYGLPFILVLLMEWLLSSCDKWSLRIWSDYGELGIYNSAMNIMSILLTFKATFVAFWSPVAMQKYEGEGDCTGFFRSAFDITRFLCVIAGICLILFRGVIILILGPQYRAASGVIPFLTLMPVFSILFEITSQGIKFRKKNRYLNYASVLAIVINIVGNAFLVPVLGGTGAALATGLTYIAYFFVGSVFSEKCYRVGYGMGKTLVYGALLMIYAGIAVFSGGSGNVAASGDKAAGISALAGALPSDIPAGIALIVFVIIMERKTLKVCIDAVRRQQVR